MDAGKWAREFFALDDGRTVAASQEDHTVFWDAATGKETGRVPEHVYGFSHDRSRFIAQNERGKLSLYAYPGLNRVAQFEPPLRGGVSAFLFSPDDRYCLVEFESAFPAPEATYPYVHSTRNIALRHMYCLDPPGEVPNFAASRLPLGTFCADAAVYFVYDGHYRESKYIYGLWKFDLKTSQLEFVKPYDY